MQGADKTSRNGLSTLSSGTRPQQTSAKPSAGKSITEKSISVGPCFPNPKCMRLKMFFYVISRRGKKGSLRGRRESLIDLQPFMPKFFET